MAHRRQPGFVFFARPAAAIFWTALVVLLFCHAVALAQAPAGNRAASTNPSPTLPVAMRIELNAVGDAHCDVQLPLKRYAGIGDDERETYVRYDIAAQQPSQVVESLTITSDNAAGTIKFHYNVLGFARGDEGGEWRVPLSSLPVRLESGPTFIAKQITGKSSTLIGLFAGIPTSCHLTLPPDSSRMQVADGELSYSLPALPEPRNGSGAASVKLDAQPRIMASLCKSYGYPVPELSVARAIFRNTGTGSITNYRVRFRIRKFADDWTNWVASPRVLPGQTVVDAFHPLFDLEKTTQSDGTRLAALDMECQYTIDGKQQEKSESQTIEILGRNEVIWDLEHRAFVLASFVTKDDPVVQRIAAMVSSQVPGGIQASDKVQRKYTKNGAPIPGDANRYTRTFLKELYRFMLYNKMVYQTPPDGDNGYQHVKYPRDVILNRAGTCVDLAIFYASVCEAVGLKPVLCLPNGHCFPSVYIKANPEDPLDKEDEVIYVETTGLEPGTTFEQVATAGLKEATEPKKGKEIRLRVDIADMRSRKIHSLELPPPAPDVLERAGITPASGDFSIAGLWKCTFNFNGQMLTTTLRFTDDGQEDCSVCDSFGKTQFQLSGAYEYKDGKFAFVAGDAVEHAIVKWNDPDHFVYRTESCNVQGRAIGIDYTFSRAKQ